MVPQVPDDKREQLWVLITCKKRFNNVSERLVALECVLVSHWSLAPQGVQHRAVVQGMIFVFLVQSVDIAQAIRDDFAADQVYFGRYVIWASSPNQVLNLVRHFQASYFFPQRFHGLGV